VRIDVFKLCDRGDTINNVNAQLCSAFSNSQEGPLVSNIAMLKIPAHLQELAHAREGANEGKVHKSV
jgi:hypothetical protein